MILLRLPLALLVAAAVAVCTVIAAVFAFVVFVGMAFHCTLIGESYVEYKARVERFMQKHQ